MKVFAKLTLPGFLFGVLTLAGCSSSDGHTELRNYINNIKQRPAGNIEDPPQFTPYESFVYSAAAQRSPFERPVDLAHRVYGRSGSDVKPDLNREKEYLEQFDLTSLQMVGTFRMGETLWVLIEDPSGFVTRVTEGNYLGKNHGRIVSTEATQLELLEIVSDGLDGWVERPRILALSEKD